MDNLKLPAFPIRDYFAPDEKGNLTIPMTGFSKLELASLMIAQGSVQREFSDPYNKQKELAMTAVDMAKIVLEEANK